MRNRAVSYTHLLHLGHGPAPIPLFFFALALGWLFERTGRLTASITLHFLLNLCTTLLLLLEVLTKPSVIASWF